MVFKWKFEVFIRENTSESVVCEMAAILSWSQCDKIVKRMKLNKMNNVDMLCESYIYKISFPVDYLQM